MRVRVTAVLVGLVGSITACGMPLGPLVSAQQTAQEFNLDARFGRSEVAIDRVAPTARDEFAAHHRAWGGGVHVADVEMSGSRPKGDHDMDIFVRFAWYRTADQELRSTMIKQDWREKAGSWLLVAEERVEGDIGLLGEQIVYQTPPGQREPSMFPTIRLGAQ
jgi:hypothetical protein